MKFEWRTLKDNRRFSCTTRARVIGGWIVCSTIGDQHIGMTSSMVFVPDIDCNWEIESY